jgi:O-antigen ligase
MAFLQNRDTPKEILGIHGLNPWNLIMLNVLACWWIRRRQEGWTWDVPRYMLVLAAFYMLVVFWSYTRVATDISSLNALSRSDEIETPIDYTFGWVTSEYLINCLKWLLPGFVLYDACRSRKRVVITLSCILALYFLIAIQVVQNMPMRAAAASGTALARIAARDLTHSVGYFRTEISMMLAGASWAVLSCLPLARKFWQRFLLIGAAGVMALGQALTGGRAGYVTWGLVGLVLCTLRWRRMLPVIPVAILGVCIFMPGVRDRMLQGFTESSSTGATKVNDYVLTSGRTLAWSFVIPKIEESPIWGWGRQAMIRTGIYEKLMNGTYAIDETFPHPHNAYLEILLDDGVLGFMLVMPIYLVALVMSLRLLMDRSDPLFSAIGGATAALILGLMIAAMGSESFYAAESSVGMWAAIGLMLRVWVERERSSETGQPMFDETGEIHSDETVNEELHNVPAEA